MDNLTIAELLSTAHEYIQEAIRRRWAEVAAEGFRSDCVADELLQAVYAIEGATEQGDIPLTIQPLKPEEYMY